MKKDLVTLEHIDKSYPYQGVERALFRDFSLSIKRSEFVAIFGPNGCGKTTLLNIISGIEEEYSGARAQHPKLRVSFVFQNYRESLFPWLTVKENIAFPLALLGVVREKQEKAVTDLCNKFSISLDLNAYPYTLSGGQQQLVAILRAVITNPNLLLMDEPFSALDYETTIFLLGKTQEIWKKTGVAIVFVSHEVDDAVLLAERIIVLSKEPTRVVQEVADDLAYPRTIESMDTEDFHATKKMVITAFVRGYKKVAINL
jgi:NitT/TauT family transport system ATP-binding protein